MATHIKAGVRTDAVGDWPTQHASHTLVSHVLRMRVVVLVLVKREHLHGVFQAVSGVTRPQPNQPQRHLLELGDHPQCVVVVGSQPALLQHVGGQA